MKCTKDIKHLQCVKPTWPDNAGPADMRTKLGKQTMATAKANRVMAHVRRACFGANNFGGCRWAWQFSNELRAEMEKPI